MLGFNDHMPGENSPPRTRKVAQMAARAGLSVRRFHGAGRAPARPRQRGAEVDRAACCCCARHGVPLLSHDDMSPDQRRWFRDARLPRRGISRPRWRRRRRRRAGGDDVVLGAPNVVRGGSHIGWTNAADMIARGFCTILASDYYYPAPLLAAFRLAADGVVPLEEAWCYVSERPARAAGLTDRGRIKPGSRADVVVVDASDALRPKVAATIASGRIVHLADAHRLS